MATNEVINKLFDSGIPSFTNADGSRYFRMEELQLIYTDECFSFYDYNGDFRTLDEIFAGFKTIKGYDYKNTEPTPKHLSWRDSSKDKYNNVLPVDEAEIGTGD